MQYSQVVGLALLVVAAFTLQHASAGSYSFSYGVNDPGTGDVKDQQETKVGDQVTGYYRLMDSDGMQRTVNYNANPKTGFRAQVNRDPMIPGMVIGQQPDQELSDSNQRLMNDVIYQDSAPLSQYV